MLLEDLKDYLCFGVAGNFANHLGEAGEADEFAQIKTDEKDAPKGMFPFYIKGHDSFLGTYPICDEIIKTHGREADNMQVEAEVALICDFVYENDKIVDITPKYFSAFNDCSLRFQDGNKLSTKKNWGTNTKGISQEVIEIDNFTEEGILKRYHIASFVKRDGIVHDYGTTSSVKSYSYFFGQLKEWMIEKLNSQEDCGPLEELTQFTKYAKDSKGILIAAGATAYAEFGKNHFLQKGDEIFVYIYDAHFHSFDDMYNDMCGMDTFLSKCSKLHQILE
ncbi:MULTISPECIES: DUF5718 family protein [Arcobacteraceae]|uniref:Uncharacterized protein n=1 Tax=Poseidonibacter parvus TaxID=1850254 RepID=A0A1P8KPF0_9BACT|nr:MULTISPECIES: DUF5718 family protein [Arcobacteraceae]APW66369.1 hypothetical protein LPB137_11180 [Poseidonibacter parvus]